MSPNRPPKIPYGDAVYPTDYDRKAQEKVLTAWCHLADAGIQAFPLLLEQLDDKRYSFTKDAGENDFNWSVGRACFDVMRCQVEPWYYKTLPGTNGDYCLRPRYTGHYFRNAAAAKSWWETHKHKSVHDLQIEVVQWILAEEAKTPGEYSPAERMYLEAILKKLHGGKVPFPGNVPWSR